MNHPHPSDIRVGIVEPDPDERALIGASLGGVPGLECLAAHSGWDEAIQDWAAASPHVVLMDVAMAGLDAIEQLGTLRQALPHARFLALSTGGEPGRVIEGLRNGLGGYLLKPCPVEVLKWAIRELHNGGVPLSPRVTRGVLDLIPGWPGLLPASPAHPPCHGLTGREVDVLNALAEGLPFKLIADRLRVQPSTVRTHAERIYGKLSVHSRAEAIAVWMGLAPRGR